MVSVPVDGEEAVDEEVLVPVDAVVVDVEEEAEVAGEMEDVVVVVVVAEEVVMAEEAEDAEAEAVE